MSKPILVLALLIATVVAQHTITYSFSATAASTQTKPSYELGSLGVGDRLTFTISLPNRGLVDPFIINIMNSANVALNPQPITFAQPTSPATASPEWTVTTAGYYYLQVTTATMTAMVTFNLAVTKNDTDYKKYTDVLRN